MARVRTSPPEAAATAALAPRPAKAKGESRTRRPVPAPATPGPQARQVTLILAIGGCAFLTLALATWSPTDPSWTVAGTGVVENLGGRVGAFLADGAYQIFGYAAWTSVLFGTRLALRLAGRPGTTWSTRIVSVVGLWLLATAMQLAFDSSGRAFPPGGLVGMVSAGVLSGQLGTVGAGMLVAIGLVACATLLFRIDWQPLVARAVDRVEVGAPMAARLVGQAGATAVKVGIRTSSSVAGGLRDRIAARRAEAAEAAAAAAEEDEEEMDAPSQVEGADRSVWSARAAPPPRLLATGPEAEPPTKVGSRTLVEIALDRTTETTHHPKRGDAPLLRAADVGPVLRPLAPGAEKVRMPLPRAEGMTPRALVPMQDDQAPPPWSRPTPEMGDDDELHPGLPELGDRVVDGPPPRPDAPLRRPVALDDDYDLPSVPGRRAVTDGGHALRLVRASSEAQVARPRVDEATPVMRRFDAPEPTPEPSPFVVPAHLAEPVSPQVVPEPPARPVPSFGAPEIAPSHRTPEVASPRPAPVYAQPISLPPDLVAPPEPPARPVPSFGAPTPSERRPAETARRGGISIVPGNLESGGVRDDGKAVRKLNEPFHLPPLSLLDDHPAIVTGTDESRLHDLARKLTAKLQDFGVEGRVSSIRPGPVITMFEYEPAPGVKLSKIAALADDVAMALKALGIRIVAPIPGRGVVGVEVPNEVRQTVWARDTFASEEFREGRHQLPIVLGKDTEGRPYVADLARAPHLLVGGTTGSGKSVGINAMLVSMLLTRVPEELRLILIDPKMLEFELYKDIPHLLHPVVTEARLASKVLAWACEEMDNRYRLLGDWKVRNIESFNEKVVNESKDWTAEKARMYYPEWPEGSLLPVPKKLPYIVVVIDELADLMMVASKDVEMSIARLAQKARASGIHLIVATQRPSADVITGLIRSNMPSRLAYQVRTKTESRIILDQNGADALLGKGDLLFLPPGVSGLTRIHGPFLSDDEVRRIADHLRSQGPPNYAPAIRLDDEGGGDDELEELGEEMGGFYNECVDLAIEKGQISTSMIQRHLKIGYNRACLLMEQLEKQGVVGPADGAKPRKVLIRD